MKNERPHFNIADAEGLTPAQLGERLFSGKFTIMGNLSHWKEKHEAEYRAAKVASGRVDPSQRERNITEHQKHQPKRQVFNEELVRNCNEFPPAELDRFYKTSTSDLHAIKKAALKGDAEAAAKLFRIESSAFSHGYITHPPTQIEVKRPAEPSTFQITDALCDRYSIPRGTLATEDEFLGIVTTFVKLQAERKQAEEAKALDEQQKAA